MIYLKAFESYTSPDRDLFKVDGKGFLTFRTFLQNLYKSSGVDDAIKWFDSNKIIPHVMIESKRLEKVLSSKFNLRKANIDKSSNLFGTDDQLICNFFGLYDEDEKGTLFFYKKIDEVTYFFEISNRGDFYYSVSLSKVSKEKVNDIIAIWICDAGAEDCDGLLECISVACSKL